MFSYKFKKQQQILLRQQQERESQATQVFTNELTSWRDAGYLKDDQEVAYAALRKAVIDYDRKYGYRGPESFIELGSDANVREQRIEDALVEAIESPNLLPAVVLDASPKQVRVILQGGEAIEVSGEGLRFAARSLDPKAQPARRMHFTPKNTWMSPRWSARRYAVRPAIAVV